jgi:hypothetical protein
MKMLMMFAAGAAALAAAVPAAAQYYPPQTYPGQPVYGQPVYGQPGYGQPGYGGQNVVGQIIDQLLGNRYNVTDRGAVSRCAGAAMTQAQAQYRGYGAYGGGGYGQQGYGQPGYGQPGYNQGFAAPSMRVTAITSVERRSGGLRVKGLLSSGYSPYPGQYGQYGYQNQAYGSGDLTFRCNVDYRGAVTNIRIGRNSNYRRY